MPVSNENRPRPRFLGPGGRVLPGVRRVVAVQTPAVGSEWAAGPPGGRVWLVLSSLATLTLSAAVGNREPGLQVVVAGVPVWAAQSTVPNTAAISFSVCGSQSATQQATNAQGAVIQLPIPELWLPEGATIGSLTRGLLGNDQYSSVVLWVAEFWGSESDIEVRHELEELELAQLMAGGASLTTGG